MAQFKAVLSSSNYFCDFLKKNLDLYIIKDRIWNFCAICFASNALLKSTSDPKFPGNPFI